MELVGLFNKTGNENSTVKRTDRSKSCFKVNFITCGPSHIIKRWNEGFGRAKY
jgi:hypothetical protein